MTGCEYCAKDFETVAQQRLLASPPLTWDLTDDDMNAKAQLIAPDMPPRPAAVLVPVIRRGDELSVLLTQRHADLAKHPGQIAFPGGRMEAGETVLAAACRETREETGIHPDLISPLGYLDGYLTVTSFFVTPVVAIVRPEFALVPAQGEVADIFEVPLAFLMQAGNRQIHHRVLQGKQRQFYAYSYGERYIWGATAGMISNFYQRLYG